METGSQPTNTPLEELSRRIVAGEPLAEDPAKIIADNWRSVAGTVLVVMLAVWLWGEFKSSQERSRGEAAEKFALARDAFRSAVVKLPQVGREGSIGENAEKAFEDNLRTLEQSHGGSVYAKLIPVYQALAAIERKEFDKAQGLLSKIPTLTGKTEISEELFVSDIAALVRVKLLLAQGLPSAKDELKNVAKSARFVNVEALTLLAQLAATDQERSEVEAIARELVLNRSELSGAVNSELKRFGLKP